MQKKKKKNDDQNGCHNVENTFLKQFQQKSKLRGKSMENDVYLHPNYK